MREGILVVGIILLVLGIFLFFTGNNMVDEVESFNYDGLPIDKFLRLFPKYDDMYNTGQSMVMFGSILGIVGFIICIAGIAAPSKKHESIVSDSKFKEISKSEKRCPECDKVIPMDTKICPYCGKNFEKIQQMPGQDIYQKVKDFKKPKNEKSTQIDTSAKEKQDNKVDKNEDTEQSKIKEKPKTKYCYECGAKLEDSPKFCTSCGAKLR